MPTTGHEDVGDFEEADSTSPLPRCDGRASRPAGSDPGQVGIDVPVRA